MLHRSYSLFSFIQRNVNCHRVDQFHIFQVGCAKRHVNILIVSKYNLRSRVRMVSSFVKDSTVRDVNTVRNLKWLCVISSRSASNDKRSQVVTLLESNKVKKEVEQKPVKLSEKELEKLKERVLEIDINKPIDETDKNEEDVKHEVKEEVMEIQIVPPKKRKRVDVSVSSLERNFITPVRAMSDFLLKPSDLESLPRTKRRSPYEFEPPITVYWRKDVRAKALEVWGSHEALLKELLRKELERKIYQHNVFTIKRRLRDSRREIGYKVETNCQEGMFGRSGKVVFTAITVNASNFLIKLFAWIYTGSHSMLSECIHSAADTCNQLILACGIYKSVQNPNADHPYGYTNMKYVASLVSGTLYIFVTALSFYCGIHGLLSHEPVQDFYWAYFVLGTSLVSEAIILFKAIHSIKKAAKQKRKGFIEYVISGQDPLANIVLMENVAAVIGLLCAGSCMGLTSYLENPVFDVIGSLLISSLLGGMALFVISSNVETLTGRSIPQDNLDKINSELESDVMVRAIHDVKGIDIGNNLVRYKAELDFDGWELTRSYLDKHDLTTMLEEIKKVENIDELESFLLKHGENIVDMLGGEIDRIELKLKKCHPEIRHCDLEIL